VQDAFKRCRVSMESISLWGAMIKSDWHSRNLQALGGDKAPVEQLQSMVDALQDEILHLKQVHREESRQLRDHLTRLETSFEASKKSVDELSSLLRTVVFSTTSGSCNHVPSLSSSPSEKKKKRRYDTVASTSSSELGSSSSTSAVAMAEEEDIGDVMSTALTDEGVDSMKVTSRRNAVDDSPRDRPTRPAKFIESISEMTFGTFFLMHQETDVLSEGSFTFKESRDASRLKRIITYARLNLPEDLLTFFRTPPPSIALAAWVTILQQKAKDAAHVLFSKIAEDEVTYGITKPNVAVRAKTPKFFGVEARIEKVMKLANVTTTLPGQRKINVMFASAGNNIK
jgi:hypothetical protein